MSRSLSPSILQPGEGDAIWSLGCLTIFKATGDLTGGRFALVDELAPRSDGTPMHRHVGDEESFFILEGELIFHLGDSGPLSARAGAFVHIPSGMPHAFRVASEHAHYLILTTPQHGEFYRAIGTPAPRRELPPDAEWDMDMLMAAAERYNVEVLGPYPLEE